MKRLLVRLSVLSGVGVLAFFAIAQAQRDPEENVPEKPKPIVKSKLAENQQTSRSATTESAIQWPQTSEVTTKEGNPEYSGDPASAWALDDPESGARLRQAGGQIQYKHPEFEGPGNRQTSGLDPRFDRLQPAGEKINERTISETSPSLPLDNGQPGNPTTNHGQQAFLIESRTSGNPLRDDHGAEHARQRKLTDKLSGDHSPLQNFRNRALASPSSEQIPEFYQDRSDGMAVQGDAREPRNFPALDARGEPSQKFGRLLADPLPRGEGTALPGSRQLEGSQLPALEIQKFAPREIQVNKTATFQIHVRNTGEVQVRNVEVHDLVPKGTQFLGAEPPAEPTAQGDLIWRFETLAPGERRIIKIKLRALSTGDIGSVATVRFSTEASAHTKCTCPVLDLQVMAAAKTLIGESLTLDISLTNRGDGPATGVILTEKVPQLFEHAQGRVLENDLGTLKPGESRNLRLTLRAAQPGAALNRLIIRGDGEIRLEKTTALEVIAPALDLEVRGPDHRYLERPATYVIALRNPGTAPAKTVKLTAFVPDGFKFMTANNHGEYDPKTRLVAWELVELAPGQRNGVELKLMPVKAGMHNLQIEGRARRNVAASRTQPVQIEGVVAMHFTVSQSRANSALEVGGETTYEIHVVNQGSKAATDVKLIALLPPGLQPLGGKGPVQAGRDGNRVIFAPLPRLAPRADTTYYITARATAPGDHRVRFQLTTAELQTPVMKEESTPVFADRD